MLVRWVADPDQAHEARSPGVRSRITSGITTWVTGAPFGHAVLRLAVAPFRKPSALSTLGTGAGIGIRFYRLPAPSSVSGVAHRPGPRSRLICLQRGGPASRWHYLMQVKTCRNAAWDMPQAGALSLRDTRVIVPICDSDSAPSSRAYAHALRRSLRPATCD